MQTVSWHRRLRETARPNCPSCGAYDWLGSKFEPARIITSPGTPYDHPELPYGVEGIAVLPVTCPKCGFVAFYSVQHFETLDPWA
jgi:ribosomal protein S27AE